MLRALLSGVSPSLTSWALRAEPPAGFAAPPPAPSQSWPLSPGAGLTGLTQAASARPRLRVESEAMLCCSCRRRRCQPPSTLGLLLLLPLVHVPPLAAAAAGPSHCETMYQGFAECLIQMGDGMGHGGELETVCRSWNDFHACTSRVLSSCPKEAAAVWESLQEEARRVPHADNLHALCGASVHIWERGDSPETNQETLRATAPASDVAPAPWLLVLALALTCLLGPLA
ncbi:neuritin-like protein [Loxodonta africana]|nr:neuritin-like protein [Loxodonta africana]